MAEILGRVSKAPFAVGSKSEHDAVFVESDQGRYVLRREGGNPFFDPELEKLVGKTVRCQGTIAGTTFIMSDWSEIDSPDQE